MRSRLSGPPVTIRVPRDDLMQLVIESVHPDNLGALPPSPYHLAYKGEQIGLGKYDEFFQDVVDWRWHRRFEYLQRRY